MYFTSNETKILKYLHDNVNKKITVNDVAHDTVLSEPIVNTILTNLSKSDSLRNIPPLVSIDNGEIEVRNKLHPVRFVSITPHGLLFAFNDDDEEEDTNEDIDNNEDDNNEEEPMWLD